MYLWMNGPYSSFKFLPSHLVLYHESLLLTNFNIDYWKEHNWKSLMPKTLNWNFLNHGIKWKNPR